MIEEILKLTFNKVAVALASCDHQKSKLRAVAGAASQNRYQVMLWYLVSVDTLLDSLARNFILKKKEVCFEMSAIIAFK